MKKNSKSGKVRLDKIDTRSPKKLHKSKVKADLVKLKLRLAELQNVLYAQSKYAVLVVLQGMDASGKDGVIRKVFDAINPAGCRIHSFKKPTELEMKHDFLWRVHQVVPEKGMIHIFNRSHYEDVLIQRVHKWIDETTVYQRFQHINAFEKLLTENNTIVLKFYLHVSSEKQLERLKERISDPTKNWKYNAADLQERTFWNQYREAYEDVFEHCNDVPWQIVPSDENWYKEYLICSAIVEQLEKLKLTFPKLPEVKKQSGVA
ncbi:MAG: PPK2 family polyphosphate kinase [Chitinophagales bacterium]